MKIIITEEQYSVYIKRRFSCFRKYVDKLLSGEERLRIPPSSFKWDTYQYLLTAGIRGRCSAKQGQGEFFDDEIHNHIMKLFGDELYKLYLDNKTPD